MYALEFRNVSKAFRQTVIANGMTLQVREGAFAVLFGAPGSGKSTLLRLITGLEKPDQGEIVLRGQVVNQVAPGDRDIGYVPQSFALYPHFSVFDNIAYPLRLMGVRRADYAPVVEAAAQQLQITHLLNKRPDQCSGGEKQRVAIARGIVKQTRIFILDDPLTGLDFKLRERLFDDLRQMKEDLGATFIYTTSDPLEALILAEDVHVIDGGRVVEAGTIETVFDEPQHARTMQLLGYPNTNMLAGTLQQRNDTLVCDTAVFSFPVRVTDGKPGDSVQVAVRPQHLAVNPAPDDGCVTRAAEVTLVEDLGAELHVYLEAGGVALEMLIPHALTGAMLDEGQTTIGVRPGDCVVYAQTTGSLIGRGTDRL